MKALKLTIRLGLVFLLFLTLSTQNPPTLVDLDSVNNPIGSKHILGTDRLGRDHLALLGFGILSAVLFSIPARFLTLSLSLLLASVPYHFFQKILSVFASVFLSIPSLLIALIALAILGEGMSSVIIALILSDWAVPWETYRTKVQEVSMAPFFKQSLMMGASPYFLFRFHIIPAMWSLSRFLFVTGIPGVIMSLALFSYLGVSFDSMGLGPGLGEQISFSKDTFSENSLSLLLPIAGIIVVIYSFSEGRKD